MIKKFSCIEIPVANMQRAVEFYEKILQLTKTYEHPVWTAFDLEGTSLALAVSGTKDEKKEDEICKSCSLCLHRFVAGKTKPNNVRPTATAVIYLGVSNLDNVYRDLKKANVTFLTEPQDQAWGGRTAVMLDPDNNVLVLSEISPKLSG